jgi:two-component system, NtrC family, response regulator AtoC
VSDTNFNGSKDPMWEERRGVHTMRCGNCDFVARPFVPSVLENMIAPDAKRIPLVKETSEQATVEVIDDELSFVASSEAMKKLRKHAELVARADIPVLILGESGTGKEVVARLVHKLSQRSKRAFLKINCAAMPSELLESELFGYEAGAFTGATTSKPGKFELCDKGTMLLDEIGEMSPGLQAKLLQVLQDGSFNRLGGRHSLRVDVRLLAATNIDIPKALATEKFRKDLYYRLNTFTLSVPPLRERKEEISSLVKHYIARYADRYGCSPFKPSPALLDECSRYSWPGNVRELCNFVKRMLVVGDEDAIIAGMKQHMLTAVTPSSSLPLGATGCADSNLSGGLKSYVRNLKGEAEAEAIIGALRQTSWNRRKAAAILNISYRALLYKIQRYGLIDPRHLGNAERMNWFA